MATRAEPELMFDAPLNLSAQPEVPPTITGPAFTQVRGVPIFNGRESKISVEDWVRDIDYFFIASRTPPSLQYSTIVRNLGGEARRLILNLPLEEQTAADAVEELKAEYGDTPTEDPFAAFYERMQRNGETAQSYAIALQSLFQDIQREFPTAVTGAQMDSVLCTQFMRGLREEDLRLRLAPMRPRVMTFRNLREEVRRIGRERHTKARRPAVYAQQASPNNPGETQGRLAQISKNTEDVLRLVSDIRDQQGRTDERVASLDRRLKALEVQEPATSSRPSSTRPSSDCWECGQKGHWRRDCPNRRSTPPNRRRAPTSSDITGSQGDALNQAGRLNGFGPHRS